MTSSTLVAADVLAADPNPLNGLKTVGLAELNGMAALQTRVDRKYLIAATDLAGLFGDLRPTVRVLEIDGRKHSDYTSTYFDTPLFDSYLDAARSRPNRFKVRVRTYLDSDTHYLEVKTRSRTRHTIKTRRPAEAEDHEGLSASGQKFVLETLADELPTRPGRRTSADRESTESFSPLNPRPSHGAQRLSARPLDDAATVAALRPTLSTHYRRITLLIEPRAEERGITPAPSRATIDTSLAFSAPGHRRVSHPGLAIIETKTAGPPSPIDRLLWQSGHRPAKVSKFGIGLALFQSQLPANKWNRILRRHFGVPS